MSDAVLAVARVNKCLGVSTAYRYLFWQLPS